MSLYQRLLGNPFVYNHVRPFVVGGVDHTPSYGALAAGANDVVLDVGCGTGDALNYLGAVRGYQGYDTDPVAIDFATKRAKERGPGFSFHCGIVDAEVVAKVAPTRVLLCGLLHHLSDDEAHALLSTLAKSGSVQRVVSTDVVYLPGKHVNNVFAWLDRGKHVRHVAGYRALVGRSGLRLVDERIVPSHPKHGRAEYLILTLEPPR